MAKSTKLDQNFTYLLNFIQNYIFGKNLSNGFADVKLPPIVFSNYVIVTLEVRFMKFSFCILAGLNGAKFHWASLNGS